MSKNAQKNPKILDFGRKMEQNPKNFGFLVEKLAKNSKNPCVWSKKLKKSLQNWIFGQKYEQNPWKNEILVKNMSKIWNLAENLEKKSKTWQFFINLAEILPKNPNFGRKIGNFIHFGRNSFIQNGNHSFWDQNL